MEHYFMSNSSLRKETKQFYISIKTYLKHSTKVFLSHPEQLELELSDFSLTTKNVRHYTCVQLLRSINPHPSLRKFDQKCKGYKQMAQLASRAHSYYRCQLIFLALDLSDHIFIPNFYSDANKTLEPHRLILISTVNASIQSQHVLEYKNRVSSRINRFLPRLSHNIYLHK